jgi:hypothetical protein
MTSLILSLGSQSLKYLFSPMSLHLSLCLLLSTSNRSLLPNHPPSSSRSHCRMGLQTPSSVRPALPPPAQRCSAPHLVLHRGHSCRPGGHVSLGLGGVLLLAGGPSGPLSTTLLINSPKKPRPAWVAEISPVTGSVPFLPVPSCLLP